MKCWSQKAALEIGQFLGTVLTSGAAFCVKESRFGKNCQGINIIYKPGLLVLHKQIQYNLPIESAEEQEEEGGRG